MPRSSPSGIRLALHGGAADSAPDFPKFHQEALRHIGEDGMGLLRAGASALETVERVAMWLEEHPLFNAGVGAALNEDGTPELDAAIMDGRTRACGAIAGVSRVKYPVRLARAVMEQTPHVLFVGAGAEALARRLDHELVAPEYFITPESRRQLARARSRGAILLDKENAFVPADADGAPYGTVGAVARDAEGHLAAATSSGGLISKPSGRLGDTPIIGAGTYADDNSVAVSVSLCS